MKKIMQDQTGFHEVDSVTNPEFFSETELSQATREGAIINAYNQAITDLEAIQNNPNPTNAQVIGAVQKEAAILEALLKFIKNDVIRG